MKKKLALFILLFLFKLVILSQQITTNTSSSLEDLISNNLAQGCVELSNISSSVNGGVNNISSYGYFERANSNFPFQNGIVLSTGNVNSSGNTINTSPLHEGEDDWLTDPDLENALGISGTLNATSIEFDFVSISNLIQFNYLLASEEYSGNNPCNYADGFAFLIKKAGSSDPYTNIALIPGTSIAVNTNTIHANIPQFCPAENEQYFEGYNIGDTNYNGRTSVLTASASIEPNVTYHIKLVIADQTDENYDSAVFIEGNSFNASVNLGPDVTTCGQTVNIDGDIQNNLATYEWFLNDTLINGENNAALIATASGVYKVVISISINTTNCIIEDEINIVLNSEQSTTAIQDFLLCDDTTNDGQEIFDLSLHDYYVLASVPSSSYNISYFLTDSDAQSNSNAISNSIQNTTNPQEIYVRIEDINSGCLAYSSFNLIVNSAPIINTPINAIVCDYDAINDGITSTYLSSTTSEVTGGNPNLYVSYHYSQQDADNGINAIYFPYTNINPTDTLYIRVYDATTGCIAYTQVTITVYKKPEINFDNQWINSCEQDEDGFAVFDLTSVIPNVLQGLNGVTVTFHETNADAETGNNPISDLENYNNTVQSFQIIYIRVVDDITGCYSISLLELHANIVQTGFDFANISVCDDAQNDGIEQFDLNDIALEISQGYTGFTLVFYETENDQLNNTNPLDNSQPYTVDTSQIIYAKIISGDCTEFVTISLTVHPSIDIPSSFIVEYCDQNDDGYTSIFMETFNSTLGQGINPVNIKYYLTEIDAINNENILAPYYNNISNPQTLYVRVTNPQTECYKIASVQLNIIFAPNVTQPQNMVICDDDSDGVSIVNLEDRIVETVADTADLNFSFYTDYNDALGHENEISEPDNYATSTQLIYLRVENNSTGCFSLVNFYIYINTLPEFIPITNFENCEANVSGVADFFFYEKDSEVLNSQTGKEVLYFETEQDAIDRTNSINKYTAYQNSSSPQTIYVRVENYTDTNCYGTSSFELEVGSLPLYNEPQSFFVCDDISNDGITTIDLNDKIAEIELGISESLTISFHPSLYDANNSLNNLPLDYSNTSNPEEIYVRIENGTYCHAITSFEMIIIQVPQVTLPSLLIKCDVDYDGVVLFDLTVSEIEILDVRTNNIVVSYHENIDDIDTDTNPILDPENYYNTSVSQTVYVKITNTISNCYVSVPLELQINLPPEINDFNTHQICFNNTNSFDLNTIDAIVRDDSTDIIFSYHATSIDAQNNTNPLDTNYTYSTSNDIIYVRVEFDSTGCFVTYPFVLQVNPLPIANLPLAIQACDDITNDGLYELDLSVQNNTILGTQNPLDYTITYHIDEISANDESSALPNIYNTYHGQTIYARIENNVTGCYSVTMFDVIIYEFPNNPTPITQCDEDYDSITEFNLTSIETELYTSLPNYLNISYFENEIDIATDTNPINNPTNFYNSSNPQTVFIKVYNTIANCYNVVTVDLIINLPPPINEFSTYEICDNPEQTFDLQEINSIIVPDTNNIDISYFNSYSNAELNSGELDLNYNYTSTNDTIYVRVAYIDTGCYYIYPFQLIINPLPIANQPNNMEACDNDYDTYRIFNLHQQDTTILGNQNPNDFSITYYNSIENAHSSVDPLSEEYNVYNNELIIAKIQNNITGCYSLTEFNTIVHPIPIIDIDDLKVICLDNLPLTVSAFTNIDDSYLWSTGATTSEIAIDEGEFGTYWVTVTTPFGCNFTKSFSVIQSEQASIDFTTTVDFSDPNSITVDISGSGNYEYILDNEDPQNSNIFNNVIPGLHTITIRDLNGCNDASKEVIVIDAPKFFTPNNDGYNDTWHIVGVEQLIGTKVEIYDRFGKILKILTHDSDGWDGMYIGHFMPETDYWFLAKIKGYEEEFELRGHFSLVRKVQP